MGTIFGKIMSKIASGLDGLRDRSARLQSQQRAAVLALEKAKASLQSHLLDGDDDAMVTATLQSKVDSAASLLGSLDDAVKVQAERVADAERQIADEKTQASRKAASGEIAADVAKYETQTSQWLATSRTFAKDLQKYSTFRSEIGAISNFVTNAANEVESAMAVTIPDLRDAAKAVLEGREKPPAPPAAVVKFVPPKTPPLTCVFAMQNLKYDDTNGQLIRFPKMNLCDLPPELAARALKLQWAIPLSDPRVKRLNASYGSQIPAAHHCCDLDTGMSSTVAPVMASSPFEPHPTRPHHGLIPEQRAPIVASRSAPIEKPED
jgi:hypothetical protein